jgi:hypothetical protein
MKWQNNYYPPEEFKMNKTTEVKTERNIGQEVLEGVQEIKAEKTVPKKKMRRALSENPGPLFIDDKYKREGYRYRIVNDTPGRIDFLESRGYSVVRREVDVGNGSIDAPSATGSAVELEVGKIHSQKAVLMEISEEDYQLNRKEKEQLADEQDKMVGQTGIPTQYGKITRTIENHS